MSEVMELISNYDQRKDIIAKFFQDEHWHCGGPIPAKLLYTDRNLFMLGVKLEEAIDVGHASIESAGHRLARTHRDLMIIGGRKDPKGIVAKKLFPKILHLCEKRRIPKNFIGGILLIYLELCERVPLKLPDKNAKKQNKDSKAG